MKLKLVIFTLAFILVVGSSNSFHFDKLFKQIVKKTEKVIQKNVQLEDDSIRKTVKEKVDKLKHRDIGSIGCTVCQTVIGFVRFEVQTVNSSSAFIKMAVDQLCLLYPIQAARASCDTVIKNINNIIALVEHGENPLQICEKLHLCQSSKYDLTMRNLQKSQWLKRFKSFPIGMKGANRRVKNIGKFKPSVFSNDDIHDDFDAFKESARLDNQDVAI